MKNNKSALYIAYHYPPILGSSGVHRSLAFTRFLSENNWDVSVLTASLKSYDKWSEEQFSLIPDNIKVIRAFARNVAKHFSWRNKYLGIMALPDNMQSWIIGGVLSGLKEIIKNKPSVIVSTYPIASAHIIAYILHKISGIPWVADLRDPMAQPGYPSSPTKRKIFKWIERKITKHCTNAIITTPGAKQFYIEKFPHVNQAFWQVIPNGYDEKIFNEVASLISEPNEKINDKITLLHSGVIYPSERDPTSFFQALAELKKENKISAEKIEIRLRATGHEHLYLPLLKSLDIEDLVKLEPPIDYKEALKEMFMVDGLLLFQSDGCNYQIPAKAYEYIYAQKPILALTPELGDTGTLLAKTGMAKIAPLDNKKTIKLALMEFIKSVRAKSFKPKLSDEIKQYSREHGALRFNNILNSIINT